MTRVELTANKCFMGVYLLCIMYVKPHSSVLLLFFGFPVFRMSLTVQRH